MKRPLLSSLAALSVFALAAFAGTRSPKYDISRNLEIFSSVFKTLQNNYVDTIDAEKTVKMAIDAMLYTIDPYTEYIPESETEEFRTISTGEFGGIGAVIRQLPSGETMIDEPQEGTPAAQAGLRAGDVILTVDGDTVTTIGMTNVRKRLLGRAGTTIDLTVRRPYAADSILSFRLKRAKIDVATMPYYGMLRDSVGYIKLNTFNEKSVPEVRRALTDLLAHRNLQGIILDLRDNGGGIMEGAVDLVGLFVPKGTEVIRTRGREASSERIYRTTSKPMTADVPLVVLINEMTASSSEITAGSLQDLDRAVIVGNRSFGKGLVQSTRQVPYNGLVKVTTARYYIPSGRLIQAIDYSHRNEDGTVQRIPDSLTSVFHTAAGRLVRDGGGITPDLKVELEDPSTLTRTLVADNWVYNYSTRFAATTPEIPRPADFEITDSIFADFKAFINPEKLKYDRATDSVLSELEKAVDKEGYASDDVAEHISALKELLRHDLDRDLDTNRKEISDYLTDEILRRYYFYGGAIEGLLRSDPAVNAAFDVLTDPARYNDILSPPKD